MGRDQKDLFFLILTVTYVNAGNEKTGIILFQQAALASTIITFNVQFSVTKKAVLASYYFQFTSQLRIYSLNFLLYRVMLTATWAKDECRGGVLLLSRRLSSIGTKQGTGISFVIVKDEDSGSSPSREVP